MNTHAILRHRLLVKAGLKPAINPLVKFSRLKRSEWSQHFEQLMRNRLIMGALRYGRLGYPNKPKYDRIGSILRRLKTYEQTGNKELLVDIANLCLCEFVECHHPLKHFSANDGGEHVTT